MIEIPIIDGFLCIVDAIAKSVEQEFISIDLFITFPVIITYSHPGCAKEIIFNLDNFFHRFLTFPDGTENVLHDIHRDLFIIAMMLTKGYELLPVGIEPVLKDQFLRSCLLNLIFK